MRKRDMIRTEKGDSLWQNLNSLVYQNQYLKL